MSAELLRPGASEEKCDEARTTCLVGAVAVSDMVKSTLGPRGMMKLLYKEEGAPIITNDGATVLKNIKPSSPAAQILVNSAKEHGENEGDGTTTLTVLTGLLLQEADRLIFRGSHPYSIIGAYRSALAEALEHLKAISFAREEKMALSRTTLSSKFSPLELDALAQVAVTLSNRTEDIGMINILKIPGGQVTDTYVEEGMLLECSTGPGQKKRVERPRVLVCNTALDSDKIKVFGAKANVSSPLELEMIESAEKRRMAKKVEHLSSLADIIVNRQLIYDYPTQEFTKRGRISIERADFSGVEMLARVLGASILSTFDCVRDGDIGSCLLFEQVYLGGRSHVRFAGVPEKGACTMVIRGATEEILDEAERSIKGAVKVLMKGSSRVVYGGGSAEAAVSVLLRGGSEGERAFSRALMEIPRVLAENSGQNAERVIEVLREKHSEGQHSWGVHVDGPSSMESHSIYDSLKLKEKIWKRAAEAAEVILRCDGVIRCRPRERTRE
jgi:T-complex protein 1 subunit beta